MRKPSPRCLPNRVALYRFTPAQDEDAGVQSSSYPSAFAADVPCSVQPDSPTRFFDPITSRLIEQTRYHVMFVENFSLVADDKIVWVDDAGVSHSLFVHGQADQAGRAAAYIVSCEERT